MTQLFGIVIASIGFYFFHKLYEVPPFITQDNAHHIQNVIINTEIWVITFVMSGLCFDEILKFAQRYKANDSGKNGVNDFITYKEIRLFFTVMTFSICTWAFIEYFKKIYLE